MTIDEYKNSAINILKDITENAEFEAIQLMCYVLNLTKNQLILDKSVELKGEQICQLDSLIKRRTEREPIQYIIGEWEFFGYKMFCGKGCLIPRPETEMLVDMAIKCAPENGAFLDLCTGSGCISTALLLERKDITGNCVDVSEEALKYAQKNIMYYNLQDRLNVYCEDINDFEPVQKFNLIISNPPYIKSCDMKGLSPEVKNEPKIALDGGEDGLVFYRQIVKKYEKFLTDNGVFLFEVGYDIADGVKEILNLAGYDTEIYTDIFGNKRVCKAIKL